MSEKQNIECKSIQKIRSGDKGFKDIAITCVSFANAQGGTIFIGCEDATGQPPESQVVEAKEYNDAISRLRSLCFNVSIIGSDILIHENGGHYFKVVVSPSLKSIATTSDGKIYMRVGDKCEPVRSEDIHRLANEKQAYQWELVCPKIVRRDDVEIARLMEFTAKIRKSNRVKDHVKQMTDWEIVENYHFVDGNYLTFLGILWLGNAQQRSRIAYPIEAHRLVALIEEDLRLHPQSTRREVQQRLPDVDERDLRKNLYGLVKSGKVSVQGGKTYRRYNLISGI